MGVGEGWDRASQIDLAKKKFKMMPKKFLQTRWSGEKVQAKISTAIPPSPSAACVLFPFKMFNCT